MRGVSQSDYTNVNISVSTMSATSAAIPIQARRSTINATDVVFTYGSNTSQQVQISTTLLGRVLMCTPTTANGLTGVDKCS